MIDRTFSRYLYLIFTHIKTNEEEYNVIQIQQNITNLIVETKDSLFVIWKFRYHMRTDRMKINVESIILKYNLFKTNFLFDNNKEYGIFSLNKNNFIECDEQPCCNNCSDKREVSKNIYIYIIYYNF